MFYAKSTGGFYDTAIHGDNIPSDAVEITQAEHAELIAGQANGLEIVPGADGKPELQVHVQTPQEVADAAKAAAAARIAAIRVEIVDLVADTLTGTPAEQGAAKAAIGLLRAELALEKAKL